MYYDDNDKRPKWDRPEIEDWDYEDDSREFSNDIIGCMPTSTPCWPRQQCWPRPCSPNQCWPRR